MRLKKLPVKIIDRLLFEDTVLVAKCFPLRQNIDAHRIMGYEPFPTIYWLSSSELVSAVSSLENRGYITKFGERLYQQREAKNAFLYDHVSYMKDRSELLRWGEGPKLVQEYPGITASFSTRGIGGIELQNTDLGGGLKCLHTHYAHYLASGQTRNIIGKWVAEELEKHCGISFGGPKREQVLWASSQDPVQP